MPCLLVLAVLKDIEEPTGLSRTDRMMQSPDLVAEQQRWRSQWCLEYALPYVQQRRCIVERHSWQARFSAIQLLERVRDRPLESGIHPCRSPRLPLPRRSQE